MQSENLRYMPRQSTQISFRLIFTGLLLCAIGIVFGLISPFSTSDAQNHSAIILTPKAQAADLTQDVNIYANDQVLVEMFLSQSCSSCVPAAEYVRELANRDDVVILSWHVDYWNRLLVPGNGRWNDPYSDEDYTLRQRWINQKMGKGRRIYTPQAVIDGEHDIVGSHKTTINETIRDMHIKHATERLKNKDDARYHLNLSRNGDQLILDKMDIADNQILLVVFHRNIQTSILGGENSGQNWLEANVVSDVTEIDEGASKKLSTENLTFALPDAVKSKDYGCALIVQDRNSGKVRAATYCPSNG